MTTRPATPDDRAFVLALADRLVSFDVPAWRSKAVLADGDRRALAGWFDRTPAGEAMLIAELDGRPAGCAYLMTLVDYFDEQPHAHLSVLAVTAATEGRGVGSALIDASIAWAKALKSNRLTLSAFVTNMRARGFYERRGFGGETIRYVLPL